MNLVLYQHPFAMHCWKALIALYDRDVPFASVVVEADRSDLARLWRPASIPVLVDDGEVVPESSVIIEYLDRYGDARPMLPAADAEALQARVWDRVVDGYLAAPVQRIVGDALRDVNRQDPLGVSEARATIDLGYRTLDHHLQKRKSSWLSGDTFSLADCAAAPALHYADVVHPLDRDIHLALSAYFDRLLRRPSVARVIEEARPYRESFPLPWPDHVT